MDMKITALATLGLVLLQSFFRICTAHSFILVPVGDFKTFDKAECRQGGPSHSPNDDCKGPCFSKDSWQYNEHEGTTTYRRGDIVDMVWTRNNHRGGFVRFTLVPESQRMNEAAHDMFAFRYACYDSDKHECRFDTSIERRCGTDKYIQRTKVEIPTSLEDGYYILGWAWFGGLDLHLESFFADYWSCSRVRIEGGLLTDSYTPVFIPGENLELDDSKTPACMASTGRLRDCAIEPCLGRPVYPRVPEKFADGKTPAPILRSWIISISEGSLPLILPPPQSEGPRSRPSAMSMAYILGLRLIDTARKKTIANKFFREIYIPSTVEGLSFVATVRGDAKAVRFYIDGEFIRVEKEIPFTAFGDLRGEVYSWPKPVYGKWVKVTVTVIGRRGNKHQKTFRMFLKKGA